MSMKINEHLQGHQVTTAKKAGESGTATGLDFQKLLAGELHKATAGLPVKATEESATPVAPTVRLEGLAATEETIGNLEAFATALEDGNFGIETLEPFVSALEEDTIALLAVKNQLPAADPLAQVLERVATAAYVETAKYRRGDYLA